MGLGRRLDLVKSLYCLQERWLVCLFLREISYKKNLVTSSRALNHSLNGLLLMKYSSVNICTYRYGLLLSLVSTSSKYFCQHCACIAWPQEEVCAPQCKSAGNIRGSWFSGWSKRWARLRERTVDLWIRAPRTMGRPVLPSPRLAPDLVVPSPRPTASSWWQRIHVCLLNCKINISSALVFSHNVGLHPTHE